MLAPLITVAVFAVLMTVSTFVAICQWARARHRQKELAGILARLTAPLQEADNRLGMVLLPRRTHRRHAPLHV